jgi:hypothetical protein
MHVVAPQCASLHRNARRCTSLHVVAPHCKHCTSLHVVARQRRNDATTREPRLRSALRPPRVSKTRPPDQRANRALPVVAGSCQRRQANGRRPGGACLAVFGRALPLRAGPSRPFCVAPCRLVPEQSATTPRTCCRLVPPLALLSTALPGDFAKDARRRAPSVSRTHSTVSRRPNRARLRVGHTPLPSGVTPTSRLPNRTCSRAESDSRPGASQMQQHNS